MPVEVWATMRANVETLTASGSTSKEDQVRLGEACQGARPAVSQGLWEHRLHYTGLFRKKDKYFGNNSIGH